MTTLEFSANLCYLLSVFLAGQNKQSTWGIGILGSALYARMFYESKLYADVTLQGFFILTSLWGWWVWKYGGQTHLEKLISRLRFKTFLIFSLVACIVTLAYGKLLLSLTDASFPFIDSFVLAFSVLAQLLLMQRVLENWWCWLIVDLVAVPLYFAKGLYLTSGIYALFLINVVVGLVCWSRSYKTQLSVSEAAM